MEVESKPKHINGSKNEAAELSVNGEVDLRARRGENGDLLPTMPKREKGKQRVWGRFSYTKYGDDNCLILMRARSQRMLFVLLFLKAATEGEKEV